MHKMHEIYKLMPNKDCGLCGNPTCRTTSRKIATGDLNIDVCVNLNLPEYKENKEKILKILEEGVEIGASSTVVIGEEGIAYIHPCVTEGKVMVDGRLTSGPEGQVDLKYGFLDPMMLCYVLRIYEIFKDVKCSPELGIAQIKYDGKSILIFQNGKIKIREALDKDDVMKTLRLVSRVIWGSIICSCCGNASVDCASGGCSDCTTQICPVLAGGPPEPLEEAEKEKIEETTGSTTFVRIEKLDTGSIFLDGIKFLDEIYEIAIKNMDTLIEKFNGREGNIMYSEQMIRDLFDKANKKAIEFIVKTPRKQDATIGLLLSGIASDLTRIAESTFNLWKYKDINLPPEFLSFLKMARDMTYYSYISFKRADLSKGEEVRGEYSKIRKIYRMLKKYEGRDLDRIRIEIDRIATNAFYIARLLPKPLPA
ncbi:MAG: (Fe-S)-binding protein [Candidatus Hydrothermarchaeota archaeon]